MDVMTPVTENPLELSEFRMPSLGADMEAGTVVEWRVQAGDAIKRGDVVGVVETDKGAIDVEIFDSGVIDRLVVPVGEKVAVGTVLALVRHNGVTPAHAAGAWTATTPVALSPPMALPTVVKKPNAATVLESARPAGLQPHHRVSPLARKLAADLHIDLSTVAGTGTAGAVCRADVERSAGERSRAVIVQPSMVAHVEPRPTPVAAGHEPARPGRGMLAARQAAMRRAIAAAMSRSNRDIPHYYLEMAIDMQHALAWLRDGNLQRSMSERLLPAVLLLKAVALAVHEVPQVNGFWVDDQFQPSEAVHLGVAISLRTGGLVTPAIHDTDTLSLDELSAALKDVIQRARAGSLRSSEIADATLTVTNLGDQGVDKVLGLIYPPQIALVGFGTVKDRPWAVEGLLGVRPVVIATLAGDHRATDGHRGGLFLAAIDRLLQKPEAL
jgi:pyruvate dehydrogenase E2 component (dihydrolipoamide acetyltransferase)